MNDMQMCQMKIDTPVYFCYNSVNKQMAQRLL